MIFWMQYRYVTKYIVKGKIFTSPKFPGFCDSNYPKLFIWGHFPWIGHHGRTRGITDHEPLLLSDYFYYKFTLRFLTQSLRLQDDVPVHRQESVWQKNIYYKWFIWEKSVHVQMQLINELPNFHRQIRTLHLRFSGAKWIPSHRWALGHTFPRSSIDRHHIHTVSVPFSWPPAS